MTQKKEDIRAKMNRIAEEIANGTHFEGKASIDSLDLVDFQKKEICSKLVSIFKELKLNEELMTTKMGASSLVEMRAAIKFRTERVTLERLVEMFSKANGDQGLLTRTRQSLIKKVKTHAGIDKIKMNEAIKRHLFSDDPELLHLDFLVGMIEKLELVAPSGAASNLLSA